MGRDLLKAACLFLLLLTAFLPRAATAGSLEDSLMAFEGRFTWNTARGEHVFSDLPALGALLDPAGEEQLRVLVACIDDPRPARATLDGQPVSLGVMCYRALRLIAYVELPQWPGHIGPLATPAQRKAAREAWQEALRRGTYIYY